MNTPPNREDGRLGSRNGEILRLYLERGLTQEEIARQFGVNQSVISRVIKRVRTALPEEDREDWRATAIETLWELHDTVMTIVRSDPPPAFSQRGEILRDEHGDVVRDQGARLAAVSHAIRVLERAARALGTDAPEKISIGATVRYTVNGVNPEILR